METRPRALMFLVGTAIVSGIIIGFFAFEFLHQAPLFDEHASGSTMFFYEIGCTLVGAALFLGFAVARGLWLQQRSAYWTALVCYVIGSLPTGFIFISALPSFVNYPETRTVNIALTGLLAIVWPLLALYMLFGGVRKHFHAKQKKREATDGPDEPMSEDASARAATTFLKGSIRR
jgi:hypothetical protein